MHYIKKYVHVVCHSYTEWLYLHIQYMYIQVGLHNVKVN